MTGMVGQFFRQFGITIVAAVLVSLFVAFTLDPMLSSRFSKPHVAPRAARLASPSRAPQEAVRGVLRGPRERVSRHPALDGACKLVVGLVAVGAFVLMFPIAGLTGVDFVNQEEIAVSSSSTWSCPPARSSRRPAAAPARRESKLMEDNRFVTVLSTLGPNGEVKQGEEWRVVTLPKDQAHRGAPPTSSATVARDHHRRQGPRGSRRRDRPAVRRGRRDRGADHDQVRAPDYDTLAPLAKQFEDALEERSPASSTST